MDELRAQTDGVMPDADASAEAAGVEHSEPVLPRTRRRFLGTSARKLVYAAPVVLLFKTRRASASGGSQLTPGP